MTLKIYDLPSEILAIIFEEGKNMIADGDPSDGFHSALPFEILATHICSYFRQISLATPSLWTSIHVHDSCRIDQIVDRLARSGACELDVRLESTAQDPQISEAKLDMIMDHILNHSLRWRSLFVRYAYERTGHPVVRRICSVPAPKLQLLSITVDNVHEADPTHLNRSVKLPHIFSDGTPRLKFVRLRGLATQFFRPSLSTVVTLHLDQIRYLPLQYLTLREILICSPYLTNLSIYGDILAPGSWPDQANTLYLPNLRSMRLYSESGETYSGIMEILDAPMLESLTLKSLQEHDLDAFWDIENQIPRYRSLTSLNFTEFDFTSLTYRRIFQTFQDITTFTALCVPVGDSPLLRILSEGMIDDPNGAPYTPWPRLETLGFAADIWGDDEGVIDAVVEARKRCGHPIFAFLFAVSADDGAEAELSLDFQGREDFEIKFCPENLVWPEDRTYLDYEDVLF